MIEGILLRNFGAIGKAVLTLLWGQAQICPASVVW